MLCVKTSLLHNAGEGLFARVELPANTVFQTSIVGIMNKASPAVDILEQSGFYTLDMSLSTTDAQDDFVLIDGRLQRMRDLKDISPTEYSRNSVAIVQKDSYLMKINDAGYFETATPEEYEYASEVRSNVVFTKSFTWTQQGYKICNIVALTLRKIKQDEELYVQYGQSFWY